MHVSETPRVRKAREAEAEAAPPPRSLHPWKQKGTVLMFKEWLYESIAKKCFPSYATLITIKDLIKTTRPDSWTRSNQYSSTVFLFEN